MSKPDVSELKPSVCPLDCPDTCSLSVGVSNDQIVFNYHEIITFRYK